MTLIFDELEQRLSVVPRWTILHTIQKQSVAEHCFNVERIALTIAEEWFNITDKLILFSISQLALHHDDEEALTGDIPATAKKYIKVDMLPMYTNYTSEDYDIVKLADLMEAWWFLNQEFKMGNGYMLPHRARCREKAVEFAKEQFNEGIAQLVRYWVADQSNAESGDYD
jgi:5'-deoxynucleotidase YfbR-like HD superfamily hydrolase